MKNNQETTKIKPNKRKIVLSLAVALSIVVAFIGGYFSRYLFDRRSATISSEIINIIESVGYVIDPNTGECMDFSEKDFADAIVNGLLDGYSAYYTKEEYELVLAEGKGRYDGVGIGFFNNDLVIDKVFGNSPADLAGVKTYDKIVAGRMGDSEKQTFENIYDVLAFLGQIKEQELVTIIVERTGVTEQIELSFKKSAYVSSYVDYYDNENAYLFRTGEDGKLYPKEFKGEGNALLDDNTAYVYIYGFEGDVAKQFTTALNYMKQRGKTKLILDLRNNGGGYMDALIEIASFLIDNDGQKRTIIAYAQGKDGYEEYSTSKNNYCDFIKNISVIANENTASASECLIGAMLHYGDNFSDKQLIVEKNDEGQARTYGKGIMQATYRLISGGAFKLTTARVLWPDKTTCIHGKGILPLEENIATPENAVIKAMACLG